MIYPLSQKFQRPPSFRFRNDLGIDPLSAGKNVQHYFGMIGYKVDLNEDVYLVPAVLIKKTPTVVLSLDLNGKLFIQDKYWLGINYRYLDSFSAFMGIRIASDFELSYSYDLVTSALSKHTSGSHEILIGYRISKGSRLVSPSDFW